MLSSLIPPLLHPPLLRLRRLASRWTPAPPVVSFGSYAEALRACANAGYEHDQLVRTIVEKTRIHRGKIASDPPVADYAQTRLLLALVLAGAGERPVRVIDFGGAAGATYFAARALLRDSPPLLWSVVETTAMAQAAERVLGTEELRFFDDIDTAREAHGGVDLVYSSGSVQYVPDPIATIRSLMACGAPYLLLTRLGLRDSEEPLISLQESNLTGNGPGPLPAGFPDALIRYPVTILPRHAVARVVAEEYEIFLEFDEGARGAYRFGREEIGLTGYLGSWRPEQGAGRGAQR
jgi:putative methyltransferase (TIGR04325 family)